MWWSTLFSKVPMVASRPRTNTATVWGSRLSCEYTPFLSTVLGFGDLDILHYAVDRNCLQWIIWTGCVVIDNIITGFGNLGEHVDQLITRWHWLHCSHTSRSHYNCIHSGSRTKGCKDFVGEIPNPWIIPRFLGQSIAEFSTGDTTSVGLVHWFDMIRRNPHETHTFRCQVTWRCVNPQRLDWRIVLNGASPAQLTSSQVP